MRRGLTALAVLLLVAGCTTSVTGGSDGTEGTDGAAQAGGDPVAGAALYADNCASCHGADLQGTDSGPPHLHPVYEPGHHGDVAFQRAVQLGAPQHHWDFGPMPPVEGLSDAEVDDIIAYVRQEQRAAGIGE